MRAGTHGGYGAALVAPEGSVVLQRLGDQRVVSNLVENVISVERTVVIANTPRFTLSLQDV